MRSYILQAFTEYPWAILPKKLAALEEIVSRHIHGEKLTAEEVQARIHGAARPPERNVGQAGGSQMVAILPLFGTIFPRANMMTEVSGATSAELFGAQFSALVNAPEIGAIVLDVNSPGGQVNGIAEVARRIYEARGVKPVVAVANHLMASAAYYIGSAAEELVVTPDAEVGSIGVFAVHQDVSRALEQDGVTVSIIKEGKYKTEGNPYEPLSGEARAVIQESVSAYYDDFVAAVALHRGVGADEVRNGFGEGRVVRAKKAVSLGMADRIGTMQDTIAGLLERINAGALPVATATTTGGKLSATINVNLTPLMVSTAQAPALRSDPAAAELERKAQSLRERVTHILNKEN